MERYVCALSRDDVIELRDLSIPINGQLKGRTIIFEGNNTPKLRGQWAIVQKNSGYVLWLDRVLETAPSNGDIIQVI